MTYMDEKTKAQFRNSIAAAVGKGEYQHKEPVLNYSPANKTVIDRDERRLGKPQDMTADKMAEIAMQYAVDQKQTKDFVFRYDRRFEEILVALNNVMTNHFGTVGQGVTIQGFFGDSKPAYLDVVIGLDADGKEVKTNVPHGTFAFAPFDAMIETGSWTSPEYGRMGLIKITAPKMYEETVEAFDALIRRELNENSMYVGQAVKLVIHDGEYQLKYVDLGRDDRAIFYNEDTLNQLELMVWGRYKRAVHEAFKRRSHSSGRKLRISTNVLLKGPYGTGKTEATIHAARHAVENGVTVVYLDSSINTANGLKTAYAIANLYANPRAVVVFEDIDRTVKDSESESTLQYLLDETGKWDKISLLMTTNHATQLRQSIIRPGRVDASIEIGFLDRETSQRLYEHLLGDVLDPDTDFDRVYQEVSELSPSAIRGTFDAAVGNALVQNPTGKLSIGTRALVTAAQITKHQSSVQAAGIKSAPDANPMQMVLDQLTESFGEVVKAELKTALR